MLLKEHNFKEHRVQANNFHSNILYSLYALYREIIVPFKFKEQLIERDYSYRVATTNLFEKVICVYMHIHIYNSTRIFSYFSKMKATQTREEYCVSFVLRYIFGIA